MEFILEVWHSLTDPDLLVALLSEVLTGWWGYLLLFGIVFSETGLLVGFFLPGDSLLFTVGVVCGFGELSLGQTALLLAVAAIVGDQFGYFLGHKSGMRIFYREDSLLFKREYVTRTQKFYEKHGGKTLIYARFVPIVRTFAPFMAGVGKMDYRRFISYNVFGGIGWVVGVLLAGYWLGSFPWIRANFEKVILGIIFLSVLPMIIEYLKSRNQKVAPSV